MHNPLPEKYNIPPEEKLLLVKMAQKRIYLPNRDVVNEFIFPDDGFSDAVFPTIRGQGNQGAAVLDDNGDQIGVFDLNHSAQEAILRTHYMARQGLSRFEVTHVYGRSRDINSYTHLANLCLTEKAWAKHTDDSGEVQEYLQYHAKVKYGWEPEAGSAPQEPYRYLDIQNDWQYLPDNTFALGDIIEYVQGTNNRVYRQFRNINTYRFSNIN